AVTFQAEIAQPSLIKPPLDHIQSGRLLAHEEDRFTEGEELRDDVCDGLGLASARRTVEDQTNSPLRRLDRLMLAAVRVEDMERLSRMCGSVQLACFRQVLRYDDPYGSVPRDRPAQLMGSNQVLVLSQVFPHRDLLEAEVSQGAVVEDLPSLLVPD